MILLVYTNNWISTCQLFCGITRLPGFAATPLLYTRQVFLWCCQHRPISSVQGGETSFEALPDHGLWLCGHSHNGLRTGHSYSVQDCAGWASGILARCCGWDVLDSHRFHVQLPKGQAPWPVFLHAAWWFASAYRTSFRPFQISTLLFSKPSHDSQFLKTLPSVDQSHVHDKCSLDRFE